jgi:hypothetical protein
MAALRVISEQALAKMSAYDMIVTVALGSILVAIPLIAGATLVDGPTVMVRPLSLQIIRLATALARVGGGSPSGQQLGSGMARCSRTGWPRSTSGIEVSTILRRKLQATEQLST